MKRTCGQKSGLSLSRLARVRQLVGVCGIVLATVMASDGSAAATKDDDDDFEFAFDDGPRLRDLEYPDWFTLSFLNLPDDLRTAQAEGKRGRMVYFGQAHCAYCEALLEVNFQDPDIVAYTREHFDVVALDIWGNREVVTMTGDVATEKTFALQEKTNFTPSVIFYTGDGEEVFRLRGYYPPYKFRAALEYVADRHYRREQFREYLARADPPMVFEEGGLIEEDFFSPPPHVLDRSRVPAQTALVVFFEQGNCHACDVLHTVPLSEPEIQRMLGQAQVVQLDMWSDTPVLTPNGQRLTAKQWAARLGIFYAPSLVFFDENGREIIRVDSVVRFFRLARVLRYVLTRAYRDHPNFQRWRHEYGMGPAAGR